MRRSPRITQERLIDEAIAIVEQDGAANLTVATLAAALGVRPPSLYAHVSGLDEIRLMVATTAVSRFGDSLARRRSGQIRCRRPLGTLLRLARVCACKPGALRHGGGKRQPERTKPSTARRGGHCGRSTRSFPPLASANATSCTGPAWCALPCTASSRWRRRASSACPQASTKASRNWSTGWKALFRTGDPAPAASSLFDRGCLDADHRGRSRQRRDRNAGRRRPGRGVIGRANGQVLMQVPTPPRRPCSRCWP